MVAIELALAETRKMLAASQNAGAPKPCQELPRIEHNFPGIFGNSSRTEDRPRSLEGQIDRRGKVYVESKGTAVLTNELPVSAE